MTITPDLPDDVVLRELGERIATARLDLNLSQEELARRAGISLRSLGRLEAGQVASQLSGFLRVCRALGIIERLEALLPARGVSPIELIKLRGQKRKRASNSKVAKSGKWTWGDPK